MKLGSERGIKTGTWFSNEILRMEDINFVGEGTYQNLTDLMSILAEQGVASGSTPDIVVGGLLLEWSAALTSYLRVGMTVSFQGYYLASDGSWGWQSSAGDVFAVIVPKDQAVAVDAGGTLDRIDIVEIRPIRTKYDAKSRQFKDPITEVVTSSVVNTKYEYSYEFQVLKGVENAAPVAPTHTAGWIKLAEVYVVGSASSIDQNDIKDVRDSDIWTTEANDIVYKEPYIGEKVTSSPTGGTATSLDKEDTIKGALNEIFARLRDLSGVQNDAAKSRHLDWGTGANQIDADLMPLGTNIIHAPTGGTPANLTAASLVRAAIQKIFDLLIGLAGVENDAIDKRHINWGTGSGQVSAVDLPIADAKGKYTTDNTEKALEEIQATHLVAKAANYTITDTDGISVVDMTTGATDKTATLPTAADNADREITLRKADSGVGKAILDGEGAETINGTTTWEVTEQYGYVTVKSNGTAWIVLAQEGCIYEMWNDQSYNTLSTSWEDWYNLSGIIPGKYYIEYGLNLSNNGVGVLATLATSVDTEDDAQYTVKLNTAASGNIAILISKSFIRSFATNTILYLNAKELGGAGAIYNADTEGNGYIRATRIG